MYMYISHTDTHVCDLILIFFEEPYQGEYEVSPAVPYMKIKSRTLYC